VDPRRPPSPSGHPEGKPLERAGPGGQCRDQPVTFLVSTAQMSVSCGWWVRALIA
jgi:hypothetical protein